MQHPPYLLAADSAALIEKTIAEVCTHRGWKLHVVRARTNHVHIVVHAPVSPERAMNDFKAWGTRRLREHGFAKKDQTIWAEHGSTPYLWTDPQRAGAIDYVENWQGGPLQKTWDEVCREINESQKQNPQRRQGPAKQNP
jgi:REP element-mobilizing transposase RayT